MYEFTRTGEQFGALTVVKRGHTSHETIWWCQCKCGEYRTVEESRLINKQIAICIKCEVKNQIAKM